MPKVHSHYENLKVGRDARPEAIRAAYRSLSAKYHPDRNANNADASRIMSIVNVAYEVLSDPVRRQEHDRWIAQAEREGDRINPRTLSSAMVQWRRDTNFAPHPPSPRLRTSNRPASPWLREVRAHPGRYGAAFGLAMLGVFAFFYEQPVDLPRLLGAVSANFSAPELVLPGRYVRPLHAPNGRPWPDKSGYIEGYERRNTNGLSELTIDNSGNDADIFAKLVSLDAPQPDPVRMVLVRGRGRLKLTHISSGTYDLRYRNLGDGSLTRSQFFTLEEVPTVHGTRPSSVTLVLDKAGNSSFGLADDEF